MSSEWEKRPADSDAPTSPRPGTPPPQGVTSSPTRDAEARLTVGARPKTRRGEAARRPRETSPTSRTSKVREELPTDPARIRAFADFFKRYMSVSSIVTAALPIPITAFKLIPTYSVQTKVLGTYTSMVCFLLLAFIFYNRHTLGRIMFAERDALASTAAAGELSDAEREARRIREAQERRRRFSLRVQKLLLGILPLLLIVTSLVCIFYYHTFLLLSLKYLKQSFPADAAMRKMSDVELLEKYKDLSFPFARDLMVLYIGMFAAAEAAFIVMAIREYLQDLLNLREAELLTDPAAVKPTGPPPFSDGPLTNDTRG